MVSGRGVAGIVFGLVLVGWAGPSAGQTGQLVAVVMSTPDGARQLTPQEPLVLSSNRPTESRMIEIDLTQRGATLLGLGASFDHATCENLSKLNPDLRGEVADRLFHPERGIGMNLMRVCVGTSDFVGEPYYTYDDLPAGETDPDMQRFSIEKDREYVIPAIKLAQKHNPDLLLFASPWSPPAWMKTTGELGGGEVKPEWYPAFAKYLLKFVQAYEAEGIPIHAMTLQNEPQMVHAAYPTTKWSAEAQRDFIRDNLGPLFRQHQVKTLIWCWDHNWNRVDFPRTILSDPKAAQFVDGTAFHHYEGQVTAQDELYREFPDKHIYFSEGSVFRTAGAIRLIDILRHSSRSYNAWVVMLDEHRHPNRGPHPASATCVERLDDGTVRYNFDYYMYGQFMKYIPRGSRQVASTGAGETFSNVAYQTPDGSMVLVVANGGDSSERFAVWCDGRGFSAELPAGAVATYRWPPASDSRQE
ncbi:MAG: glycoside hydrolase family 30 beta sandwich domain-containing protein [Pirellulales bacterium]